LLGVVDKLFLTPWLRGRVSPKSIDAARWFFLHSLANAFVVLTALPALSAVANDPVHALDGVKYADKSLLGAASVWPLTIINSVHVYHMTGGFKLSPADYFHHLLFIPTLGFPGQAFSWGPLANWQAFFISGLPGGIDYLLLGLYATGDRTRELSTCWRCPAHVPCLHVRASRCKIGRIDHMVEKRVNANLNIWLRAPGILAATVLLYQV
jgi:hypothetical protein